MGLILRPRWGPGGPRSRRARHAAVWEVGGAAAWEDRWGHASGHRTRPGGSRRCPPAIFYTTEMIAHGMGHGVAWSRPSVIVGPWPSWQRLRKRVEPRLARGHQGAPIVEGCMPASYIATNPLDLPRRVRRQLSPITPCVPPRQPPGHRVGQEVVIFQSLGWHCRSFIVVAIIGVLLNCVYPRLRRYKGIQPSKAGGFLS
jgi:hypothetical protein